MNTDRRRAVAALAIAGLLWGTTVPLSKLALEWLPPGWLAFARFGIAAAILLAVASRTGIRAACTPAVFASGAVGYGGTVIVQNSGITRTSVTHAALLIGAVPVLVAIVAALWHHTVARPVAWAGFAVSLAGVGLIAGGRGGGATAAGDGLVLISLLLSALFTVAQVRMLRGRDPVALTAVQFVGAALAALAYSAVTEGVPAAPHSAGAVLATIALAVGGTLLPFTLFAYGQSRVSAEVAGAFLNLEPLVGAVAGVVVFGNPAGPVQAAGGAAILGGIALSSVPALGPGRHQQAVPGVEIGPGPEAAPREEAKEPAGAGAAAVPGCAGHSSQLHGSKPRAARAAGAVRGVRRGGRASRAARTMRAARAGRGGRSPAPGRPGRQLRPRPRPAGATAQRRVLERRSRRIRQPAETRP